MTDRADRIMGAVMGSFMGDALALGSHWHYDLEKRDLEIYPGGIKGFDQPVSGHYHEGREPGDFTHYGDACMVLLLSLARHRGFDAANYADEFANYFQVYAGYLDKATKAALAKAQSGAPAPGFGGEDNQTGGISRNGLVALITSPATLEADMDAACGITQANATAIDAHRFHGRLLHALLQDLGMEEAIALAVDQTGSSLIQSAFDQATAAKTHNVVDATGEFGRACSLPSTLPATIHAVLRHGSDPKQCLLEIVKAGGDNASRAMVAGCWLGAAHGLSALPTDWSRKMSQHDEVLTLADKLAALAA